MGIGNIFGIKPRGRNSIKGSLNPPMPRFQRHGALEFKKYLENFTPDDRKKLEECLSEDFGKNGKISNDQILKIVSDKLGYSMKVRLARELTPRNKIGLTQKQIQRNINLTRWSRGDENLESFEKGLYGVQRGTNISAVRSNKRINKSSNVGYKNGRISVAKTEAEHYVGSDNYGKSVGQFAGGGKGKVVSINKGQNQSISVSGVSAGGQSASRPALPISR